MSREIPNDVLAGEGGSGDEGAGLTWFQWRHKQRVRGSRGLPESGRSTVVNVGKAPRCGLPTDGVSAAQVGWPTLDQPARPAR